MTSRSDGSVTRRRVFYIPGFDPYPPRRYRELYRREGASQAAISGYRIAIKGRPRNPDDGYGWRVAGKFDEQVVTTEYEVMLWRDLVQASMGQGIPATYLQLIRTSWLYIRSGALRRLAMLRKGPVIAALYPIAALLVQAILAIGAGLIAARIVSSWTIPYLGLAFGLPLIVIILRWFRSRDHRFFAYYLMHDYAFTASRNGAYPPELETRMESFRARIRQALNSDLDEVLVVGHSSGAHIAISILADLDRAGEIPDTGPALGLLTLGQVVPMVSFLPAARRLRGDLAHLAAARSLFWLDVTAPGDGCSFALCDPVAVSGVSPKVKLWPIVISAAFSQTLQPETWEGLKRRYFRVHFQYLCAFDRPGDYDYFQITAGPRTLAARFRGRKPSQSRIDVPASPYTDIGR